MLNKEKFKEEIWEIACNGEALALDKNTGNLCSCSELSCLDCTFSNDYGNGTACYANCRDWCNSEYKELKIDWSKVPIDTPIYVKFSRSWKPRYFDKSTEDGIYYFSAGRTSFTKMGADDYSFVCFSQAKLAREEDIEKYSK